LRGKAEYPANAIPEDLDLPSAVAAVAKSTTSTIETEISEPTFISQAVQILLKDEAVVVSNGHNAVGKVR
jgi:hypothetical protein